MLALLFTERPNRTSLSAGRAGDGKPTRNQQDAAERSYGSENLWGAERHCVEGAAEQCDAGEEQDCRKRAPPSLAQWLLRPQEDGGRDELYGGTNRPPTNAAGVRHLFEPVGTKCSGGNSTCSQQRSAAPHPLVVHVAPCGRAREQKRAARDTAFPSPTRGPPTN